MLCTHAPRVGGLLLLTICCGCLQVTSEVSVEKDGSGTLLVTTKRSAAGPMGAPPPGGAEGPDRPAWEAQAEKLGQGVTLASLESVEGEGGAGGVRAVYAFEDIRQLRLSRQVQVHNNMVNVAPPDPEAPAIVFGFEAGAAPLLTITLPPLEEAADEAGGAAPPSAGGGHGGGPAGGPGGGGLPEKEQLAMMRTVFRGAKIHQRLRVAGTIEETNAAYVNNDRDGVTLLYADLGALAADDAKFQKLLAVGEAENPQAGMALLDELEECAVEQQEEIRVRFR